ncbi:hypothetical protein DFR24_4804 [Panacagrimonas perspica]|uniref:PglZ domain-containing protein n=1 Tax=Panacagrimonas perspica TaxID=381431 RepID=A0A4R7NRU1_9GAMM|nr:BREX-2 system phosphatase PglZ [Panacagrimonas perspica]TDU23281.1 hypothetical protein DFR24_4804 [Panacagrimonas perspica]THD02520.1 alkaline phosphatase [Panacagrimonas perspica]
MATAAERKIRVSSAPPLSTAQITAQLDAVLGRDAEIRAVAIRTPSRGEWPRQVQRRDRTFRVEWCESSLALREALISLEPPAASADGLLLLTPLPDTEVPLDVLARLARARVFQPKGWDLLRQQFGVQNMDARLGRYDWMPDVLAEVAGANGFAPVASGMLDLDTAWREVLSRVLQIDQARPDASTLLAWTLRPDTDVLLSRLPQRGRSDVMEWLASNAGNTGKWVIRCIEAGRAADATSIGLVCDVLFSRSGEGESTLAQAAVRLERYVGDQHIGVQEGRQWAEQTHRFLDSLSLEDARPLLDRADHLLQELRVPEWAHLCNRLPSGLDQRLQQFAQVITSFLDSRSEATAAEVEGAANSVLDHRLISDQVQRADRVRMARRVVRWLIRPQAEDSAMEALVASYADDGAFVDRARYKLLGGDNLSSLTEALTRLRAAALEQREAVNKRFATALASSLRQESTPGSRAVPLESLISQVVAPLAAASPVLLLVVDGLSLSIFRELFERCERLGWAEWIPESRERPLVGLAAIPTITEVSRHSLLAGKLSVGAAASEKSAFAAHADLLAVSNASSPPRLFHKGDLSVEGGLSPEIRAALGNPSQKIVGVVYNAVDDHLGGPQQLETSWSLETLRLLVPLLSEARAARRALVVTADHGHVLEDQSSQVNGGSSDRWRSGTKATQDCEVVLSGSRVLTASGEKSAVCLWSESARYTGRKNGYHGGASPAEVIVPLSVFSPHGINLPGWKLSPPQMPEWWDAPNVAASAPVAAAPPPKATRKPPPKSEKQQGLFGNDQLAPVHPVGVPLLDWTRVLIESPIYVSQRLLAARVALADAQMQALLHALHERGGKLSRSAIAQKLGQPEMRMSGLLSAARRMLNVDQAPVLVVDDLSGTVELNHTLLIQQFQLSLPKAPR